MQDGPVLEEVAWGSTWLSPTDEPILNFVWPRVLASGCPEGAAPPGNFPAPPTKIAHHNISGQFQESYQFISYLDCILAAVYAPIHEILNVTHENLLVFLRTSRYIFSSYIPVDPSHISHNALERYPIMHHFCNKNVHISATKWYVVGYETGAL